MGVPELTNFGSLVRFALDLETAAVAFYDRLVDGDGADDLSALANELSEQHRTRRRTLERIRANVNEMILEPVAGLDGRRYAIPSASRQGGDGLPDGIDLEEMAARFYRDSSSAADTLLAEAARAFRKLGDESARNARRLRDAGR